jgi:hypothetical protein
MCQSEKEKEGKKANLGPGRSYAAPYGTKYPLLDVALENEETVWGLFEVRIEDEVQERR